jgi:hypothetical protein
MIAMLSKLMLVNFIASGVLMLAFLIKAVIGDLTSPIDTDWREVAARHWRILKILFCGSAAFLCIGAALWVAK